MLHLSGLHGNQFIDPLRRRYPDGLEGSRLKDANEFHLDQLEDCQESDNDLSSRRVFGKEEMEGDAPVLSLKKRKYFLHLLFNTETVQNHFMDGLRFDPLQNPTESLQKLKEIHLYPSFFCWLFGIQGDQSDEDIPI